MILYIGNFLTEDIVKERGIPFRNAAGSNRIFRISSALSSNNLDIEIISPGISLRSKPKTKKACQSKTSEINKIKIYFAHTSPIIFINILLSTLSIINRIYFHSKSKKLSAVIIYNFSLEILLITIFVKLFTKAKIINNIEDISIPKFSDWKSNNEVIAPQQLIFFFCMKLIARLSDSFIIPTEKFIKYLPIKNKPIALVTGCVDVKDKNNFKASTPVKLLFSGKIEFEHGIELFINTVEQLNKNYSGKFEVIVCGTGPKEMWLKNKLKNCNIAFVKYLGFVNDEKYNQLLDEADICLVLQNPAGRYSEFKTPSKFYEYIASGKCVISSDSGDYSNLPPDLFLSCEKYDQFYLQNLIEMCINDNSLVEKIKNNAYKYALSEYSFKNVGKRIINQLKLI